MEQEKNKKKILLVDDEPINHKIVQFLMKAETEYEILGADGGRQALEILREQKVDLVLLDIEMPDMNGKEVLSKIRECYEIPVAFVTAGEKADEGVFQRGKKALAGQRNRGGLLSHMVREGRLHKAYGGRTKKGF